MVRFDYLCMVTSCFIQSTQKYFSLCAAQLKFLFRFPRWCSVVVFVSVRFILFFSSTLLPRDRQPKTKNHCKVHLNRCATKTNTKYEFLNVIKLWPKHHTSTISRWLWIAISLPQCKWRVFKCKNKVNRIYAHTFATNIYVAVSCQTITTKANSPKCQYLWPTIALRETGQALHCIEFVQRDPKTKSACLIIERNKQINYAPCLWNPKMHNPCPIKNHLNKFSLPHFQLNHNYYF